MSVQVENGSIQERFQHLFDVISGQRFLSMQALNNEVPFFICPFKPQEALEMERLRQKLINRLTQSGVRVLEINLYDLSIKLLQERDIWEQILEVEQTVTKDELKELLQGVLDPESHLIPAIANILSNSEFDVLFLSGIGEVYPYIRSHNVLNNLQKVAKEKPTLMFFPGVYTQSLESGATLELFGRLHDDKYYRAKNIFQCEA